MGEKKDRETQKKLRINKESLREIVPDDLVGIEGGVGPCDASPPGCCPPNQCTRA